MIKSIIFPFTHLTRKDAEILSVVFKSCVVLSMSSEKELACTSHEWRDTRSFEFIPMPDKDLKPVMNSVNAFSQWALIHQGNPDALKAMISENPFCTSNNDVSAIYSKIRKDSKVKEPDKDQGEKADPFLQALLFLRLAQQWDADTEAIDRNFTEMDKKESDLFVSLRGEREEKLDRKPTESFLETNENISARVQTTDQCLFMAEKRVRSWAARLMMHLPDMADDSPLFFVTTSATAMSMVESMAEDSKLILDINRLKVHEHYCEKGLSWRNEFFVSINRFLTGEEAVITLPPEADDDCSIKVGIKFYLFFGDSVKSFFCFSEHVEEHGARCAGDGIPVCFIDFK